MVERNREWKIQVRTQVYTTKNTLKTSIDPEKFYENTYIIITNKIDSSFGVMHVFTTNFFNILLISRETLSQMLECVSTNYINLPLGIYLWHAKMV